MLHFAVDQAFDDLLRAWRCHQAIINRPSASVPQRAAVRLELDTARNRMHQLRLAVHPEPHEMCEVIDTVWCESLETVVHLRWVDRHPSFAGNFACPCGALVEIDWQRLGVDEPWQHGEV